MCERFIQMKNTSKYTINISTEDRLNFVQEGTDNTFTERWLFFFPFWQKIALLPWIFALALKKTQKSNCNKRSTRENNLCCLNLHDVRLNDASTQKYHLVTIFNVYDGLAIIWESDFEMCMHFADDEP